MRLVRAKDGGALFARQDAYRASGNGHAARTPTARPAETADFAALAEQFTAALPAERRDALAAVLGVTPAALDALGVGWADGDALRKLKASGAGWPGAYPAGAFAFPERDGGGRVVGFSFRAEDGRKGAPSSTVGAKRGLIVPSTLSKHDANVFIVEGASDVAACVALGLPAVGRPSNSGGAEMAAQLLEGRAVLVVGENDAKPGGAWPGRDGAKRVAQRIANTWGTPVLWSLPPADAKDMRAWLQSKLAGGLRLDDEAAVQAAAADTHDELLRNAKKCKPTKTSAADLLVQLAEEVFRFGQTLEFEAFAVRLGGPNVALMFRGSREALRGALAREFKERTGGVPKAAALADALVALQGEAQAQTPEPVALRLARHEDGVALDLGDADGRAVIVRPGGWEVVEHSPVLFRRTALTAALPNPERGGDIDELRALLNIDEASWPLLVGWLTAALIPDIPHPILLLSGQQGAGKTTAAVLLTALFDASNAPARSPPNEPEQWCIAAAGSWAVVIDNISSIPTWMSDSLCKAVTGDGWIRRKLYTDGELAVLSFRRVIALTSIDPGALRGDLGDRLLLIDLEPIGDGRRREDSELRAAFTAARPRIFGALLDLLADVLERLPRVRPADLPRMADFGRVLAAVDELRGTNALAAYMSQRGRIAEDVVESDPVGVAIRALVHAGPWSGTAGELLARLTPAQPPAGWPRNPRAMAGRLKRLIPALAAVGVTVRHRREPGGSRARLYEMENTAEQPSPPSRPSLNGPGAVENADFDGTVGGDGRDDTDFEPSLDRPAWDAAACNSIPCNAAQWDGRDGRDGISPHTSQHAPRNADGDEDSPPPPESDGTPEEVFEADIAAAHGVLFPAPADPAAGFRG